MTLDLGAGIRPFFVANLRNSQLLRSIRASKGQVLITDLFGPDLFRSSLKIDCIDSGIASSKGGSAALMSAGPNFPPP